MNGKTAYDLFLLGCKAVGSIRKDEEDNAAHFCNFCAAVRFQARFLGQVLSSLSFFVQKLKSM